jgi:hypothetical protein
MNRQELIELAKLQYDFDWIFTSIGFRRTATENMSSGAVLTTWTYETSTGPVSFWVGNEDEPALLQMGTDSSKMRWEKLDLINHFHTGGDWSLLEHFVTSGASLMSGPLAEIASASRIRDFEIHENLPLEERLSVDPLFRRDYERNLRQLAARKAAENTFSDIEGSSSEDLLKLTSEEFAERVGLLNWEMLWNDESKERWFVPDLLCAGRAHGFPAPSGIGKSLFWLEIAAGLTSGKPVLGNPAQEPIRVLYLDHENTPKGDIKPRLQAMGFKHDDLANFHYLSFPSIAALNTRLGGKSLAQILDYFQPELVFIDTFSRFVEGEENGSAVAQSFYEYTGKELKRRGIAYLRIDHVGKDASKGARGSSAKSDDLDLIWIMSKTKEPNVFLLKNEKARVPVSQDSYLIERLNSPLAHVIRSGVIWSELIDSARKHDLAVEMIEQLKIRDPKHSLAQGKVWKELGDSCKAKKISRDELFEALKFVKGELTYDDEFGT